MNSLIELRVNERCAGRMFHAQEGVVLGGDLRVVRIEVNDPRVHEFERYQAQRRVSSGMEPLFWSWRLVHKASPEERAAAEVFHLRIDNIFEPCGEVCGTEYDESVACPECGFGRKQTSELILDLRRIPKHSHLAQSIANEMVISQSLAEAMLRADISGWRAHRLRAKRSALITREQLLQLSVAPRLVRGAEDEGIELDDWRFWLWLNSEAQAEFRAAAYEEIGRRFPQMRISRSDDSPWYQLCVTAQLLKVADKSRFGISPFEPNGSGISADYVCPLGHVLGLNLISKLHIRRNGALTSDIASTDQGVGLNSGVLRPQPMLVISPRFAALLQSMNARKLKVDVAYLDP